MVGVLFGTVLFSLFCDSPLTHSPPLSSYIHPPSCHPRVPSLITPSVCPSVHLFLSAYKSIIDSYLELILKHNDLPAALRFAAEWGPDHTELYDDEMQQVLAVTMPRQLSDDNFLRGNRFIQKLKLSNKLTLYLSGLTNNMLLQFLSSDTSRNTLLLGRLINSRLTLVVRAADLPENYNISQVTHVDGDDLTALRETSNMIPCFYLRDYIPNRKNLLQVDCYMPGLHDKPAAAAASHNPVGTMVRVPDTKHDKFLTDLIEKVVIPRELRERTSVDLNLESLEVKKVDLRRKRTAADAQLGGQDAAVAAAAAVNSALSPTMLFNTIKNTFDGTQCSLICVNYSADCTKVACGFQDSVVRVFDINAQAKTRHQYRRHMDRVRPKSQDVSLHLTGGGGVGSDGRLTRLSSFVDGPVGAGGGAGGAVDAASGLTQTGRTGGVYHNMIAGATDGIGGEAGGSMIELIGHSKPVYGVSQDASANLVASVSADRTIRLWDTSLVKCVSKYSTTAPCWDVEFGPFGYYFCTAGHDRTATVYTTDRLTPLRVFLGHVSDVTCVRWHPNPALVMTGSDDRTCRLWDLRLCNQSNCVRTFCGPCCNNITSIDISPNGAMLAAGNTSSNNQAYVYDIGSGKLVGICCEENGGGTESTTLSVAFDPSSRALVTGSDDCVVRTWDVDNLVLPSLMSSSTAAATAAVAAPDLALIAPSNRLFTKATAVYGLKFANVGLRGSGILFGAGPLDTERVQQELRNSALGEGLAARSVGINYAIPDVR